MNKIEKSVPRGKLRIWFDGSGRDLTPAEAKEYVVSELKGELEIFDNEHGTSLSEVLDVLDEGDIDIGRYNDHFANICDIAQLVGVYEEAESLEREIAKKAAKKATKKAA